MKNSIYVLCLSLLACMSCSKDELIEEQQTLDLKTDISAAKGKEPKITVCHYAKSDNTWEALEINSNALEAHIKHGDAVDMDGDGYYNKDNGCSETDCDDNTYSEDNSCCFLTDATIRDAVSLWFSDQAAAINTYGHISDWCTSDITDMSYLFSGRFSFNEDISNWDVSNVTNMNGLFAVANAFNQDLSNWDVSNVTNMNGLFSGAYAFNQDISSWDVGSVTNMQGMFSGATSFNQDIGNWDVSSVTNMGYMFYDAISFNQDLSGWCVSNIPGEPALFDDGIWLWTEARPVWGTCPL